MCKEKSKKKIGELADIVTRNNIVWKLARGSCLCYCKTFVTEKGSTLLVSPKIKYYSSKENHQ